MARTVKHFSLHRIAGTELRVVSDVDGGVIPVIQVEEAVIREYARQGNWPHRYVTLFVLQDLQPLVRQLTSEANLPSEETPAVDLRPMVNIYDLADPSACHVYVNHRVMVQEGYWDDPLYMRGLLAHEHAHPLAEGATIRASRQLGIELSLEGYDRVHHLLVALADKLCRYAPRELFANEVAIRSGFGEALLHLNRHNVANACLSVAGREDVYRQAQQQVDQGKLSPTAADVLLMIGDLQSYLDLALEIVPFYRAGRENNAQELEESLERDVFPYLEPEVIRVYSALRGAYVTLRPDLSPPEFVAWGDGILALLTAPLADRGIDLRYHLKVADGR
jgi:hypothetical protein